MEERAMKILTELFKEALLVDSDELLIIYAVHKRAYVKIGLISKTKVELMEKREGLVHTILHKISQN